MTINGTDEYLTNSQWMRLMEIVNDEKPIHLEMPRAEGEAATLYREETKYVVKPDGSFLSFNLALED